MIDAIPCKPSHWRVCAHTSRGPGGVGADLGVSFFFFFFSVFSPLRLYEITAILYRHEHVHMQGCPRSALRVSFPVQYGTKKKVKVKQLATRAAKTPRNYNARHAHRRVRTDKRACAQIRTSHGTNACAQTERLSRRQGRQEEGRNPYPKHFLLAGNQTQDCNARRDRNTSFGFFWVPSDLTGPTWNEQANI